MKIALFGGSFDPVHNEHIEFIKVAKKTLALDKIIVIPSHLAPHKRLGAVAKDEDRLNMCRLALQDVEYAEVSDFELCRKEKNYTYITAEHFADIYRGSELYFLVGADMLEDFFTWKNPERILSAVTLAAQQGEESVRGTHKKFRERFLTDYIEIPFTGKKTSSTELRVKLAFGKETEELPARVSEYIRDKELYRYPVIAPALALEKEERKRHSYRVALMAVARARGLNIAEEKAMLAAALHDCGKYVPLDSPLLNGFVLPDNEVPAPVVHQYTGAYLAEHCFGIGDEEILDAIRYHTSGREDMTPLGKLIFLADMLESGREFDGIEELRKAFWRDLDECLLLCFEHQNAYLKKNENKGFFIYSLTERAYEWLKSHRT